MLRKLNKQHRVLTPAVAQLCFWAASPALPSLQDKACSFPAGPDLLSLLLGFCRAGMLVLSLKEGGKQMGKFWGFWTLPVSGFPLQPLPALTSLPSLSAGIEELLCHLHLRVFVIKLT